MERGIDTEHVKQAIKYPDNKKSTFENRISVRKKIENKEIEVIYYKDSFRDKKNDYIIVTAYYIDK